ncbi:MAG: hypothetical protein JNK93_17550, partial [Planctomycetia bacterium]|nr:hypothetical protein [Planctomycetia bacterium]
MKRSLALMFALGLALSAAAQDDKVAGQKSAVTANLTKTGIKKIATADTKNIQVLSTLSEARAKTIAEAAQKTFAFTH